MTLGRRRQRFSAVAAAVGAIGVAILLPLSVFLVSAWLFGWQLLTVESASMEPTFPVGSLLVGGQVDPADVKPGMAIVFEDPAKPGRLVTHRVVGIAEGAVLAYVVQGDANNLRDAAPVPARNIRGRILWQIAGLGRATEWLQWPRNFIALVILPGALLVALQGRDRWRAGTSHAGAAASVAG